MHFPENEEAETAFDEWLAQYKQDRLDGSLLSHFLTAGHLRDAFMAGLLAGTGEPAEQS